MPGPLYSPGKFIRQCGESLDATCITVIRRAVGGGGADDLERFLGGPIFVNALASAIS